MSPGPAGLAGVAFSVYNTSAESSFIGKSLALQVRTVTRWRAATAAINVSAMDNGLPLQAKM